MKIQSLRIAGLCLAFMGAGFAQKVVPNHAVANLVLGQSDFVSNTLGSPPSSFSLNRPAAIVVDPVSRKVFVADSNNGRVLRFANASMLTNGAGAEAVFGKPSFGENSFVTIGQKLIARGVRGLFLDRKGRLWVADSSNHRVLCFEAAAYRSSYPYADRVFGQPDFNSTTSGTTAATMRNPQSVWVDSSDRLWVSDLENHRVLRFDSISTKFNGAAADGVLGQDSFTASTLGPGASNFRYPYGICVSPSGTLFVADTENSRVLRFANAASLGNGADATGVLGQMDFTTHAPGLGPDRFTDPMGVWPGPGDDLWVVDADNNRVLRFAKASTIPSGSPAVGVVGQPNFTNTSPATSNRRLRGPAVNLFVDTDRSLWVPDNGNNRVLRFPPDVKPPVLTIAPRPPATTTRARQLIRGTARDFYGVSKVHYRINNSPVRTAVGKARWRFKTALKKGNNRIRIYAVDSVGNRSPIRIIKIRRN